MSNHLFAFANMSPTPSYLNIITRDYQSMALACLSLAASTLGIWGGLAAVIVLLALIQRVRLIRMVFRYGVPVEAFLIRTRRFCGEWRVAYRYSYDGTLYEASNAVIGFRLGIRRGNCAIVFLNPSKPGQSFIAHLFLNGRLSRVL